MNESKKMCIVVFGGTVDKLYPAAIMSSGAVMNDMEVDIFLTFWGLLAFKKGAPQQLKAVSKDYEDMGEAMMNVMQAKNVPSWYDTLVQAKEMGNIRIHACAMTADLFEMELDDFEPVIDDIIGVGEFVGISAEADTTLYLG
ncbi:DsrE/DsrF/DrsH-like family protein [Alicyclobacillus tolerans]|uniref:DsrE/DsrF/DrsH-like family protein n=1 Tax=Alicyclobacillus tolerans TaxID=90970 RepID=UPI001F244310|nr:DsrE/DsrF/DrsH-like family protein [Alicyclobacillus tolerans]MCF8565399.1 DsrE/DsrF/DrsH-like family protein [Alicyclobacillus tolerans]